jgi:urease accessory protein
MTLAAPATIKSPREFDRSARQATASLSFEMRGGRTMLARHHVTRAFHLDPRRPDLATLYLQSASGGLYRGDRLALDVRVAARAAAHLTTQSSTIVHDTRGRGARQIATVTVGPGGFLAITPDPLVLFPGSAIASATEIALGVDASAIVTDGFGTHDPTGDGRAFDRYAASTIVRDNRGDILIADRGSVQGRALLGNASPLGPYRAAGTLLVLGRGADRVDVVALERCLDELGCLSGIGVLPNGAGLGGRLLAPEGGILRQGLDVAFRFAFEGLIGHRPAARRK